MVFFRMTSSRVQLGPKYTPDGLGWGRLLLVELPLWEPSWTLLILQVAPSRLEGRLDVDPRTLSLPARLWPNKQPWAGSGLCRESAGSGSSQVFVPSQLGYPLTPAEEVAAEPLAMRGGPRVWEPGAQSSETKGAILNSVLARLRSGATQAPRLWSVP